MAEEFGALRRDGRAEIGCHRGSPSGGSLESVGAQGRVQRRCRARAVRLITDRPGGGGEGPGGEWCVWPCEDPGGQEPGAEKTPPPCPLCLLVFLNAGV